MSHCSLHERSYRGLLQISRIGDPDMADPAATTPERPLLILKFRTAIESEIDPMRVDCDMNERIAWPPCK